MPQSLYPLPLRRCAIYTRRSLTQGSEVEFGSIEAQRDICASYISSQRPKHWSEIAKHYDDDGLSGGTLNRPALQELLSDIETGAVDVVVIYKLDRITRTLLDFVRLMDLFEQFGVAFVAVTQNFDTADSTGRLILNILLTFAQFEREITSDRLRDKFTAMRQRGMFVGGNVPYGYDLVDRKLVINAAEANVVRWMFRRYLQVESFVRVKKELDQRRVVRRGRMSKRGLLVEGRAIGVGSVWGMLGNPLYVGDVRNRGTIYPGAHQGIVSRALWDEVQAVRARRRRSDVVVRYHDDMLRNLMFDSFGRKMGVFRDYRHATMRRYYISNQSEWGRRHGVRRYRAKADELDAVVLAAVEALLADRKRVRAMLLNLGIFDASLNKLAAAGAKAARMLETATPLRRRSAIKALVERIELSDTLVKIIIRVPEVPMLLAWNGLTLVRGNIDAWSRPHHTEVIDVPSHTLCMKRVMTMLLQRDEHATGTPNARLIRLLDKARAAQAALDERELCRVSELATRIHCHPKRFTHLVRLNYLAPDIIASIRDGTQPVALNAQNLMAANLPMDWAMQRRMLGFPDQPDYLRAAPGW